MTHRKLRMGEASSPTKQAQWAKPSERFARIMQPAHLSASEAGSIIRESPPPPRPTASRRPPRSSSGGGRRPPAPPPPIPPRNVLPIGSFVASVASENASYLSVAIRIRVMPTAVLTN